MKGYANCSDDMLVQAYMEGKDSAFDELLARNQQQLFDFILALTRDKDKADDLFQETFIRAIVKMKDGQYFNQGKFLYWLMRIARNLLIDDVRKQKKGQAVNISDDELLTVIDCGHPYKSREDMLVAEELSDHMRQLMDLLPDEQREVVLMRYYQGLQFKDIAEITNVSINTSLGRMRYAIRNMRRMAKRINLI
ncbi:sigma-70 family RNA polymerase sigma factor [Prevotella brevis]|uniref:Sigma-70 family RNA polymerase sigma factor n=1 Tax=Xylanibacter brevis TaxID=83231 RepID=A0ABS9CF68_9BACT|nr:sigma-70 family RNA polymerase sigma factor [Xylanibacter brevis]MCF2563709.1 sigma-70 family RNA polymerase sigma factor [Xylanibacter brevis]